MRLLGSILRDHIVISMADEAFTPAEALALHKKTKSWITEKLNTSYFGKTVVVTHHGPRIKCAHPHFGNNQTASGFISNLDTLVKKADFWCYGHSHLVRLCLWRICRRFILSLYRRIQSLHRHCRLFLWQSIGRNHQRPVQSRGDSKRWAMVRTR